VILTTVGRCIFNDILPRQMPFYNYPLTAKGCVSRIYTELAVIDVTPRGFAVIDMVPGLSLEELQARTDAPLQAQSAR